MSWTYLLAIPRSMSGMTRTVLCALGLCGMTQAAQVTALYSVSASATACDDTVCISDEQSFGNAVASNGPIGTEQQAFAVATARNGSAFAAAHLSFLVDYGYLGGDAEASGGEDGALSPGSGAAAEAYFSLSFSDRILLLQPPRGSYLEMVWIAEGADRPIAQFFVFTSVDFCFAPFDVFEFETTCTVSPRSPITISASIDGADSTTYSGATGALWLQSMVLRGAEGDPLTVRYATDSGRAYAQFAGGELVQIPEPGTGSLAGLLALCLWRKRMRSRH